MSKFYDIYKHKQKLEVTEDQLKKLEAWLSVMVTDSISARKPLEASWRKRLAQYEGVPKLQERNLPIENAPNIEVTIGATAVETINAQVLSQIWNITPLVTARPVSKDDDANSQLVEGVKALQEFANHLSESKDVGLREASEDALLDCIQLGTMVFYIPWVEKIVKTKSHRVMTRGPKVRCIAPEDIIVASGARTSIEEMPIFGFQFYYDEYKLAELKRLNNVDTEFFHPLGSPNMVRTSREILGQHMEGPEMKGKIYDVQLLYIYYDIDEDGYEEDLMVIYNHTGNKVGLCVYNPMDRRPVEKAVYQRRPHMFFGLGVLDMTDPYEEKLSDIHNYATVNMLLANCRMWVGDSTVPDNLKIHPGKVLNNLASKDSLANLQLADVYGSVYQEQMMVMQLANNRVGINDVISPGNVPNRTPGITTMSMLQQVNTRFGPAFDSIRNAVAGALIQCLYRYQERLLAGDSFAEGYILKVLGYTKGSLVIDLLKDPDFDENVTVELTAATAYRNTAADRQDSVMLTQLLGGYYQRTLELAAMAANPQVPPEIRKIAVKIADAAGEVIERTIRTFDTIRDPKTFIIEVEEEMNSLQEQGQVGQEVLGGLFAGLLEQQQQQQSQKQLQALMGIPPEGEGGGENA